MSNVRRKSAEIDFDGMLNELQITESVLNTTKSVSFNDISLSVVEYNLEDAPSIIIPASAPPLTTMTPILKRPSSTVRPDILPMEPELDKEYSSDEDRYPHFERGSDDVMYSNSDTSDDGYIHSDASEAKDEDIDFSDDDREVIGLLYPAPPVDTIVPRPTSGSMEELLGGLEQYAKPPIFSVEPPAESSRNQHNFNQIEPIARLAHYLPKNKESDESMSSSSPMQLPLSHTQQILHSGNHAEDKANLILAAINDEKLRMVNYLVIKVTTRIYIEDFRAFKTLVITSLMSAYVPKNNSGNNKGIS
jgi:hypothetical protein